MVPFLQLAAEKKTPFLEQLGTFSALLTYFVTFLLIIGLTKINSDVPVKAEPAGAEASFHSFGGFCGEKERIPLLKQPIDTLLVFLAIF